MKDLYDKETRRQNLDSIPEIEMRCYFDTTPCEDIPISPLFKYFYRILSDKEFNFDIKTETKEIRNYLTRKPVIKKLQTFKDTYHKLTELFDDLLTSLKNDSVCSTYIKKYCHNLTAIESILTNLSLQLSLYLDTVSTPKKSQEKLLIYMPYLIASLVVNAFPGTLHNFQFSNTHINDTELEKAFDELHDYYGDSAYKDFSLRKNLTISATNKSVAFEKHILTYRFSQNKSTVSSALNAFCKICKDLYQKLRIFCICAPICKKHFGDSCDEDLSFLLFSNQLFQFNNNCQEFFSFFIFFFGTTIRQKNYEFRLEQSITNKHNGLCYNPIELFEKFPSIDHQLNTTENSTVKTYISNFIRLESKCKTTSSSNSIVSFWMREKILTQGKDKSDFFLTLYPNAFVNILYDTGEPYSAVGYNGEKSLYYKHAPLHITDLNLYRLFFLSSENNNSLSLREREKFQIEI